MICPRHATSLALCNCFLVPGPQDQVFALSPAQRIEYETEKDIHRDRPRVIGIVGTRRRDTDLACQKVTEIFLRIALPGDSIVSGGCPKGGDRFAEVIAKRFPRFSIRIHYPDKTKLNPVLMEKNPRAAFAVINYARNALIARDAEVLIACVAKDRKGGTEDTIKRFLKKLKLTEAEALQKGVLVLV